MATTTVDPIDLDDTVFVTAVVRDPDNGNQATDPLSGIIAIVKVPAGTETTYTYGTDPQLSRLAVGTFQIPVTCTTAGDWRVRFKASDNQYTTAAVVVIPVTASGFS